MRWWWRRGKRELPAGKPVTERGAFLQLLADEARLLTGGQSSALCLFDSSGQQIKMSAGSGTFADQVGDEAPSRYGLSGTILAAPRPITCLSCETVCCPFASPTPHHHVVVPIHAKGRISGALCTTSATLASARANREKMLTDLAGLAGSCLSDERVAPLAVELGALMARQRISADVHDGVTQSLVSVSLRLNRALAELPFGAGAWPGLLEVRDSLTEAIHESRAMIRSLRTTQEMPEPCERMADVLRRATREASMLSALLTIEIANDFLVPRETAEQARRIVVEALTNAGRHANASSIVVRLAREGQEAVLSVSDNGRGFTVGSLAGTANTVNPGLTCPAQSVPGGHFGTDTMRLRAAVIGGRIDVFSAPGRGTEVVLRWPETAA
jgi:signal transduction histidine kinase